MVGVVKMYGVHRFAAAGVISFEGCAKSNGSSNHSRILWHGNPITNRLSVLKGLD